jgi:hypothetical protein
MWFAARRMPDSGVAGSDGLGGGGEESEEEESEKPVDACRRMGEHAAMLVAVDARFARMEDA